jgi:hypothetical protein
MKSMKQLFIAALAALTFASCVKVNFEENPGGGTGNNNGNTDDPNVTKILQGTYDKSVTLRKGKYTLKGYVYVNNGASITFEPGCIIVSDIAEKGALIVERGSKLIAEGTATEPVIFTSGKAPGSRVPGDWGGIILLGKAPTNRPTSPAPIIEGGVNRPYGGSDPADNSGTLRYVRIEFAGIAAEPGSEINGLTMGGVGSGTRIEYVQVSYGNDDAYEFFGGTVSCKYLIAHASADDDLDFDFGYSGNIQYAVTQRDPLFVDSDAGNGVESDNDGSGTAARPFTRPVLSNVTWIGPNNAAGTLANHNFANRWRRATRFVVRNSIMMGYQKAGFSIESDLSLTAYKQDSAEFRNILVHAVAEPFKTSNAAVLSLADMTTKATGAGCIVYANASDIQLTDPFNLTAPNFLPRAGSPALTGASFTGLDAAFFTPGTFVGAFGATNWMANWTSFTPKTNVY